MNSNQTKCNDPRRSEMIIKKTTNQLLRIEPRYLEKLSRMVIAKDSNKKTRDKREKLIKKLLRLITKDKTVDADEAD